MGYMKIPNLYKVELEMLEHDSLYILEKIHGTSAHVTIDVSGAVHYHSGGCKHDRFVEVAKCEGLESMYIPSGYRKMTLFGEAYGGNIQRMRHVYGNDIRFIVFDCLWHNASVSATDLTRPGDYQWARVPDAHFVANLAGYEFVPYCSVNMEGLDYAEKLAILDKLRDSYSDLGVRRGFPNQWGEGIIIKPSMPSTVFENGARAIAKHKNAEFLERERQPARQADTRIEHDAKRVADDWVTPMRLAHVLDKFPMPFSVESTPQVCSAMLDDVKLESAGEIVWSQKVERAIKVRAAELYRLMLSRSSS